MTRDKNAGGHAFIFDTDVCGKCGMTRRHFDDNGEPNCTGKRPPSPQLVPDDDEF
jgi:hypothetical protein